MEMLTANESTKTEGVRSRPFYHRAPTAVSIRGVDFVQAFRAIVNPDGAIADFKAALASRTGKSQVFLTDSGRSALYTILLTIKKRRDRKKVILPAYSCPTVAQAILKAGLIPMFCDVSEETLGMNRDCLKELIDEQTLAIIPTYLYGLPHDITDLIAIGHALGVTIIEDATQSFGAEINGKPVGTIGDFGFYSMGRGKCIPTGSGGVIVSNDIFAAEMHQTLQELIPGATNRSLIPILGYLGYGLATTPFGWWWIVRSWMNPAEAGMDRDKLPPFEPGDFSSVQAGIGTSILKRYDQILATRLQNALILTEILCHHPIVLRPVIQPYSQPAFLRFPIILKNKYYADAVFQALSKAGIGVSRSYTRTLPEMFSDSSPGNRQKYPGAEHLADCLLTLPTHHMSQMDIRQIEMVFSAFDSQ